MPIKMALAEGRKPGKMSCFIYFFVLIFVVESIPVGDYTRLERVFVDLVPALPQDCCFNGANFRHGDVVLNVAESCQQLVCNNGFIEQRQHGQPGDMDCCEFDGVLYSDCAELPSVCFPLICRKGEWVVEGTISDCCKHCYLYNDPHISTFDGVRYDWHGTCNYSVAQKGFSKDPSFGVFSDFSTCNDKASCLRGTTFRDNPHTVIRLSNGDIFTIQINFEEFTVSESGVHQLTSSSGRHPVFVWRVDDCIFLLGSSKIAMMHCQHRLDVWAHPSLAESLFGLCGYFNYYENDDFTTREGISHPLSYWPLAFPQSWLTNHQARLSCFDECEACNELTTRDPCNAGDLKRREYMTLCRMHLEEAFTSQELNHHIVSCTFDVCMMYQSGESEGNILAWLRELRSVVSLSKKILDNGEGDDQMQDDDNSEFDWGYQGESGPDFWPDHFALCGGDFQSPIDIVTADAGGIHPWKPFIFSNYDVMPRSMTLMNNGHTAQVTANFPSPVTITGGGLEGEYTFLQFHFHWGMDNNRGSEHTIDGRRYPAELHLVHFNKKYGTATEALKHRDGLAVLGIFIELGRSNIAFDKIINGFLDIRESGTSTSIMPFALEDLLPADVDKFYRYFGSLTTPTCNEVVTWTVFQDIIEISHLQLAEFRKLMDSHGDFIVDNFRPTQPLKGRKVYAMDDRAITLVTGNVGVGRNDFKPIVSGMVNMAPCTGSLSMNVITSYITLTTVISEGYSTVYTTLTSRPVITATTYDLATLTETVSSVVTTSEVVTSVATESFVFTFTTTSTRIDILTTSTVVTSLSTVVQTTAITISRPITTTVLTGTAFRTLTTVLTQLSVTSMEFTPSAITEVTIVHPTTTIFTTLTTSVTLTTTTSSIVLSRPTITAVVTSTSFTTDIVTSTSIFTTVVTSRPMIIAVTTVPITTTLTVIRPSLTTTFVMVTRTTFTTRTVSSITTLTLRSPIVTTLTIPTTVTSITRPVRTLFTTITSTNVLTTFETLMSTVRTTSLLVVPVTSTITSTETSVTITSPVTIFTTTSFTTVITTPTVIDNKAITVVTLTTVTSIERPLTTVFSTSTTLTTLKLTRPVTITLYSTVFDTVVSRPILRSSTTVFTTVKSTSVTRPATTLYTTLTSFSTSVIPTTTSITSFEITRPTVTTISTSSTLTTVTSLFTSTSVFVTINTITTVRRTTTSVLTTLTTITRPVEALVTALTTITTLTRTTITTSSTITTSTFVDITRPVIFTVVSPVITTTVTELTLTTRTVITTRILTASAVPVHVTITTTITTTLHTSPYVSTVTVGTTDTSHITQSALETLTTTTVLTSTTTLVSVTRPVSLSTFVTSTTLVMPVTTLTVTSVQIFTARVPKYVTVIEGVTTLTTVITSTLTLTIPTANTVLTVTTLSTYTSVTKLTSVILIERTGTQSVTTTLPKLTETTTVYQTTTKVTYFGNSLSLVTPTRLFTTLTLTSPSSVTFGVVTLPTEAICLPTNAVYYSAYFPPWYFPLPLVTSKTP